jgi:uncharacterized membrane-anchored protein
MKTSARDIQLFVAGTLALTGFYALCWLLEYSIYVQDGVLIFQHVIGVLMLALGIGIFIGSARAVLITLIILWIDVIGGFTGIPIYCYLFPSKAMHTISREAPEMLANVILLGLMIWSRSRRFRHDPDA